MEYTSLDEKVDVFADPGIENSVGKLYCIDTMQEFNTFRNSVSMKRMIFRGMNEAKYKIFSSLQRRFQIGAINSKTYPTLFSFMYREIQDLKDSTVLPEYYKSLGTPVTDYLYMSFLQHYSAPTSLIDFSESLNVALYFATRDVKYSYQTKGEDISNYVSLYWIDKNDESLPSIYDIVVKKSIEGLKSELDIVKKSEEKRKVKINSVVKPFINDCCLTSKFLFQSADLGLISGKNDSKYHRLLIEDKYYWDLCKQITTYLKTRSKSSMNLWQDSLKFLFKQTIVIANLNQVAQHGCFIHFTPQNVGTALEEYVLPSSNSKLKIHCANIHKSLCPYIQKWLYDHTNVSQQSLFPNPQTIAENAYNMSIANL